MSEIDGGWLMLFFVAWWLLNGFLMNRTADRLESSLEDFEDDQKSLGNSKK